MKKSAFLLRLCGAVASLCIVAALPAYAQATRTWVSGVGNDADPCSRTAPCKTFAGAISKTAPGGEMGALDHSGFGAVTITNGITIDGGGQVASILVSGTNGIGVVVNAGANDVAECIPPTGGTAEMNRNRLANGSEIEAAEAGRAARPLH